MVRSRRRRGFRSRLGLLLVLLLLIAVSAEVTLRMKGYQAFQFLGRQIERQQHLPRATRPDDALGWVNAPGTYDMPPAPGKPPVEGSLVVRPDGSRATSPTARVSDRRMVFLGGSFAFGWLLRDDETMAWRVAERFPAHDVLNFGTNGYGAYQSLLRLERFYADDEGTDPELVIYLHMGHHPERDVATADWQLNMSQIARDAPVPIPFSTLDPAGAMQRHAPQAWPVWPGSQISPLLATLQGSYAHRRAASRTAQAQRVHLAVVGEMDALVRSRGGRFLVVVLTIGSPERMAGYKAFCTERGIEFLGALDKRTWQPEMQVPGDGHPNGAMNALWVDKLEPRLRGLVD
jgi:hypothetical protein